MYSAPLIRIILLILLCVSLGIIFQFSSEQREWSTVHTESRPSWNDPDALAEIIRSIQHRNQQTFQRLYDLNREYEKSKFDLSTSSFSASWPCLWGVHANSISNEGSSVEWGCGIAYLQEHHDGGCVVYSFTAQRDERDIEFESKITDLLSGCELHVFGTAENDIVAEKESVTLHHRKDGESLSNIMDRLGHSHLDILNVYMDTEQIHMLFASTPQSRWPSIGQMNLKMNGPAPWSVIQFLEDRSLRLYKVVSDPTGSTLAFIQKEWSPNQRHYIASEAETISVIALEVEADAAVQNFQPRRFLDAKTCDLPDIESKSDHWMRTQKWFYTHIMKTMGTTIYAQLPDDFRRQFYGMMTFEDYERKNQVNLRNIPGFMTHPRSVRNPMICFDHLNIDEYVDLGMLRCSDINEMEVLAVLREPFEWFFSHCNQFGRTIEEEIACVSGVTCQGMLQRQLFWLSFQYDWNMTVITKENTKMISEWFAKFGLNVRFDVAHHANVGKTKMCKSEDLTAEQRHILERVMEDEIKLYDAAQQNKGMLQMRHHLHWTTSLEVDAKAAVRGFQQIPHTIQNEASLAPAVSHDDRSSFASRGTPSSFSMDTSLAGNQDSEEVVEWWKDQHINKEYRDQFESTMQRMYEEQFDAAKYDILTVQTKVGDEAVHFRMYGPKRTAQTDDIVTATIRRSKSWESGDNQHFQVRPHCQDTDFCGLFVDIGANIGYWSLFMAFLGYDVLAFEAMTVNALTLYATLQDLVSPKIKERVRVFAVALSDVARDSNMKCVICSDDLNTQDGIMNCGERPNCWDGYKGRQIVDLLNLRHFMDDMFPAIANKEDNLKAISNLKIDVEGHEPEVLNPILDLFERGLIERMFAECFGHPHDARFFGNEIGSRMKLLNPSDLAKCTSTTVNLKYERYAPTSSSPMESLLDENNKKFVIATAVTVNTEIGRLFSNALFDEIFPMTQQNWNHYALQHGYALSMQNEDVFVNGRKAGWAEIAVIRKHFALGYEYVMYSDIDWLFVDMTKSLEDLINADSEKHIFVSYECCHSPNKKLMQGTLIMKNSDISRSFLNEWESLHDAFDHEINHSQIAFEQMLKTSRHMTDKSSEFYGFGTDQQYDIDNQPAIEQWERWSKYFHVFTPQEFMTYDFCINKRRDQLNIFGIHFPGSDKAKRMAPFAARVVRQQSIAPQKVHMDHK